MTRPATTRAVLALVLVLGLVACRGEHRPARDVYNRGVEALATGDFETAQQLLLDARSQAGVDPELRFRAAYDLGMAFAAHADKVKLGEGGKQGDLAQALALARQALSWFGDAARLRKDDANTQANLAIVRARVQSLADQLREAEGTLDARLDRLIDDQRGVLDDARGAWLAIKQAGGADPLAQQGTLTHLADRERGIVAEAGVVADLSADEIDAIGKKAEDKRSDEEKVRVVQLKNLELYLLDARTRIAEARRKLQELAAEDGVARAEAALIALKRAREQMLDPISALRGVAQDQVVLLQETSYAAAARGTLELDPGQPVTAPREVPGWLASDQLATRQTGLRDRVEEVRARLVAASLAAPDPVAPAAGDPAAPATPATPAPQDPEQAKLLARVRAALPAVGEASAAMARAQGALGQDKLGPAREHERAALVALAAAIEQFADLKQTIELAYADQQQLVALLSPEAAAQRPAAERATETRDALARNVARMPRIAELLVDEVAKLEAQAQQAAAQAPAPPPGAGSAAPADPQAAAAAQALDQQRQMLARAEELRAQAQVALAQLAKAITANQDPLVPAKEGEARLAELRMLFFSVIEHLQQLIRDQGETRDQTSAAHALDEFAREPKLPGLIGRQDGHGELAKAITEALAAQADEAATSGGQPGPSQGPDPKTLSAAAGEVRLARGEMADAGRTLTKARDATTASESLEPAVARQAKALEHLAAALRLLQPPKQDDQDKQDKQDKSQPQEPQPQDEQDQQSKAGGASQRARDEDARRQKERAKQAGGSDPVEKDW